MTKIQSNSNDPGDEAASSIHNVNTATAKDRPTGLSGKDRRDGKGKADGKEKRKRHGVSSDCIGDGDPKELKGAAHRKMWLELAFNKASEKAEGDTGQPTSDEAEEVEDEMDMDSNHDHMEEVRKDAETMASILGKMRNNETKAHRNTKVTSVDKQELKWRTKMFKMLQPDRRSAVIHALRKLRKSSEWLCATTLKEKIALNEDVIKRTPYLRATQRAAQSSKENGDEERSTPQVPRRRCISLLSHDKVSEFGNPKQDKDPGPSQSSVQSNMLDLLFGTSTAANAGLGLHGGKQVRWVVTGQLRDFTKYLENVSPLTEGHA
ncbi:hypothetical protein MMC13_008113 [Lambiella insularis]|nr:hypothetical protein [Lambiella insularis]